MKICTLLLSLCFVACASQPQKPVITPHLSAKAESTLQAYRPSAFQGSFRKLQIFIDNKNMCDIGNGTYCTFTISPGAHTASLAEKGNSFNEFTFTVPAASENYYLRIDLSGKIFSEAYIPTKYKKSEKHKDCHLHVTQTGLQDETQSRRLLAALDLRVQHKTCTTAFLFVNPEVASQELGSLQLVPANP